MALFSYKAYLSELHPYEPYFCDTSFIINSVYHERPEYKLKTELIKNDCTLVFNSIVRNELYHTLRGFICDSFYENNLDLVNQELCSIKNDPKVKDWLKEIHKRGFGKFFQDALGNNGGSLKKTI